MKISFNQIQKMKGSQINTLQMMCDKYDKVCNEWIESNYLSDTEQYLYKKVETLRKEIETFIKL